MFGVWLALAAGAGAAQAPDPGASALQRIAEQSDLQAPASSAFRLRARFHLPELSGADADGVYQLYWTSPTQWREETSAGAYKEVRVAVDGKFWEANSAGRRPWRMRQLASLLNVKNHFRFEPAALRLDSRRQPERCFVFQRRYDPPARYCLRDGGQSVRSEEGPFEYEYRSFADFSGRTFPRAMTAYENGKQVIEVAVEELAASASFESGLFARPEGSVERCLKPVPPEIIEAPEPRYPGSAVAAGTDGVVEVYARIGTDGKVHDPVIIRVPSKAFADTTIQALAKWTFRPASCDGTPVPFDTILEVTYQLR